MPCIWNESTGAVETIYERYQREVAIDTKHRATLDSDHNPLKPGALYCEVFIDLDGEKTYGRLVRFGGIVWDREHFFDADTGEEVHPDGDELAMQNAPIDTGFICCGANTH